MFGRLQHRKDIKKGYDCYDLGQFEAAAKHFENAIQAMPSSWEAHFGLGVVLKWLCRWEGSLEASVNATQLRPGFEGSWWNVGIAATALGKWLQARRAWNEAGVKMECNAEPTDMNFGRVPIRLKTTNNEVLWCDRLDPARARIVNVPTPESEHRYGDLLLTDGEPVGSRWNGSEEVSVFNELQILEPSGFGTYVVKIENATGQEAETLILMSAKGIQIEDWSTVRIICRACSEGRAHERHDHEGWADPDARMDRRIAFAAKSASKVAKVLKAWQQASNLTAGHIECLVRPR